MIFNNMNLKFKILVYSGLDLKELNQNILKMLKSQGYIITDVKEKTISFKDDTFALGPTTNIYKKVDSGIFVITNLQENYEVEYRYFVSLAGPIFLTLIAVFLSLVVIGNPYVLLLVLLVILQFIFRISSLKSASRDMLSEIISEPNEKARV